MHHGPGRVPAALDPDTGAPPVSALLDQPTEEMTAIRPLRPGGPTGDGDQEQTPRRPAAVAPVSRPPSVPLAVAAPPRVSAPVVPAVRPGPTHRARHWVIGLVALVLVLVVAGVVSAQVLSRGLVGADPTPSTSSAPPSASASATPATPSGQVVKVVSARDFDPQGDTREENRDQVPYAIDGKPDTRWTTVTYKGNPRLGGIKRGVGLVLDLGSPVQVGSVRLRLSGDDTDVQLRVPAQDPATTTAAPMTSDRSWRSVASRSGAGSSATLTPDQPVTTRFVLVYLTSLPKEGSGYKGGIYEAEVLS